MRRRQAGAGQRLARRRIEELAAAEDPVAAEELAAAVEEELGVRAEEKLTEERSKEKKNELVSM